jgi:putative transcriptional regulator
MKESISNTVAKARQEAGVTQEGLATAVAVSRQTISALEKGNYIPSVLLAMKIATFFSLPVEEIFSVTYEKK